VRPEDNIHVESIKFEEYVTMDSQSAILADIISNAIKSVFSKFAQQQRYEKTYYQQPMTSVNITSSCNPIRSNAMKN
jgi:DNA-binding protein YbaB